MSATKHAAHGREPGRALLLALLLTVGYSGVEALAGWWAGSLALLSDAGHMLSDGASLGIAAFAAWAARRPTSARHSSGFGRAEIVAGFVNAAFMLGVLVWIAVAAVQRLLVPQPGHKNMNTRGALVHVMGDLLGSVAALVAGAVIATTGWTPIDPLLSLFICALILLSSLRLFREALHALMEGTPLHVWTVSSDRIALSAHVILDDMAHWNRVHSAIVAMLAERYGIDHVTVQPETTTGTVEFKRS